MQKGTGEREAEYDSVHEQTLKLNKMEGPDLNLLRKL
jgi:hypothetical protein